MNRNIGRQRLCRSERAHMTRETSGFNRPPPYTTFHPPRESPRHLWPQRLDDGEVFGRGDLQVRVGSGKDAHAVTCHLG
jgi:hypothetical protein